VLSAKEWTSIICSLEAQILQANAQLVKNRVGVEKLGSKTCFPSGEFLPVRFFLAQSVFYAVAIVACALMLRNRTRRFRFCAAAKREGSPSARYAGSPDICQKCPIGLPAAGRVSISTADLRQSLARLSATQKLAILALWWNTATFVANQRSCSTYLHAQQKCCEQDERAVSGSMSAEPLLTSRKTTDSVEEEAFSRNVSPVKRLHSVNLPRIGKKTT